MLCTKEAPQCVDSLSLNNRKIASQQSSHLTIQRLMLTTMQGAPPGTAAVLGLDLMRRGGRVDALACHTRSGRRGRIGRGVCLGWRLPRYLSRARMARAGVYHKERG